MNLSPVQVRRLVHAGRLRAIKDNRGHWLVHLPRSRPDIGQLADGESREVDAILTNLLMDELSYLEDRSDDQDREVERLRNLAERQNTLLGKAVDLAEKASGDRDAAQDENRALSRTIGRATDLLERAIAKAEDARTKTARLRDLLDRSLAVIEAQPDPGAASAAQLAKLERLIERAMDAAEAANGGRRGAEERLHKREDQLDRMVALLEKSLIADSATTSAPRAQNWLLSVFTRR
ncbi:MAG: hypothetical protein O7A03_05485 [Alphaproteobacteria bacterium]|nr:hypothetical protein [Alphaproteobacteria bacterium]